LTQLPIKDSELEHTCILSFPEIPSLTLRTVKTFAKQKAETQDNKEKEKR
jgi:hypothetical protein